MSRKHMLQGQIKSVHVKGRYSFRIPTYLFDFAELSVLQSSNKISRNTWISAAIFDFYKRHVSLNVSLYEKHSLKNKIEDSENTINEALAILFSSTYIPYNNTEQLQFKFRTYDQGQDALQNLMDRLSKVLDINCTCFDALIKKAVILAILDKMMRATTKA